MESESEPGTAVAGVERRQTTECGLLGSGGSGDLEPPTRRPPHPPRPKRIRRPNPTTRPTLDRPPHPTHKHNTHGRAMTCRTSPPELLHGTHGQTQRSPPPAALVINRSRRTRRTRAPAGRPPGTRLRDRSRYPRALSPTRRCLIKSEPILPFRERCAAATVGRVRAADPRRTWQASIDPLT
jgi:hypothetical protein